MLVAALVNKALARAGSQVVADVRIGLGYTAVLLDGGGCGLAYTFRDEARHGCSAVPEAGTIRGRPAAEVVRWAASADVVAAGVGVAAVNALFPPPAEASDADVRQLVRATTDDTVGMVGYFGPLVPGLRERAGELLIFERHPSDDPAVRPAAMAPELLPRCDIVILSATVVINHTIDALLPAASRARELLLLGPSTPMVPDVFAPLGVTWLSGVGVVDPARLLRIVSEGGGTRRFGAAVRKVSLRLGPAQDALRTSGGSRCRRRTASGARGGG